MPLNPVPGDLLTNGLLVAIVVLLHIQIAAFLIGATSLAIVSEAIGMVRRSGDERHDRLGHGLVKAEVYLFSFGAAVAIFFMVVILGAIWGRFFVALQQITFWVFFAEALTFVAEVVLIYTLYANWGRLRVHRPARLGMLFLLNLAQWWQMFFIDAVASFMLTPNGGDVNFLDQILNPTQIPLTIHRTVGNIAWAGAALACIAALRYWRLTRSLERTSTSQTALHPARSVGALAVGGAVAEPAEMREARYWDWVAQWGAMWAVGVTLLQPWIGYSYAKEIQLHAYPAWFTMMFGDLSNVFLVQITLLGAIFTIGSTYFWRRMRASGAAHHRRQGLLALLLLLVTMFAAQPAWLAPTYENVVAAHLARPFWEGGLLNPLGDFIPYKVSALIAMVFLGLWSLTVYLRAVSRDQMRPGLIGRRSQALLVALGVVVSVMMIVMGVIRENSRQPFLISGELTIHNQQIINAQPSQVGGSTG
jgi:hypothetical protein